MFTLDNYIGNDHVKEEARIEIQASRRRQIKLANILVTGPAGSGKTHLIRAIGHEADIQVMNLNSPLVKSLFRDVIDQLPIDGQTRDTLIFGECIVFFDESHKLAGEIQDTMLKIQLEKTVYVEGIYYNLEKICWAYATTDPERMLAALRQRCQLRFELRRYTIMEMGQILLTLVLEDCGKLIQVAIPGEVAHYVAQRSRFIPRIGQQYMECIYNIARIIGDTPEQAVNVLTVDLAEEFFKRRKVTPQGLIPIDFDYLRCLDESRKPLGVKTIASQLDVNDAEVSKNVEPFLRHLNLISFTKSGRELTTMGKDMLRKFDQREYTREQLDDLVLLP
jgi:Holliday junction DNA helicase RuvB